jgi:hypothetical protein
MIYVSTFEDVGTEEFQRQERKQAATSKSKKLPKRCFE